MADITIKNRAQINLEQGYLDRVIELANLPSGTILVLFHDHGRENRPAIKCKLLGVISDDIA